MYYIYILSNESGSSLYIGITNNLMKRLEIHKRFSPSFSSDHNKPLSKLVYVERFTDINQAVLREQNIKALDLKQKCKLISLQNPNWENMTGIAAQFCQQSTPFSIVAEQRLTEYSPLTHQSLERGKPSKNNNKCTS